MANRHFGEIGDIWKHLPLAEILSIERPMYYAESHAGSARYPLSHSPERDYGVFYFLDHAGRSPELKISAYFKILKPLVKAKDASMYPGSPWLALRLLGKSASKFLFCDQDAESLRDIQKAAGELHVPPKAVETLQGDGIDGLETLFSGVSSLNAESMFAFLDPYQPMDRSPKGLTTIDLFYYLARRDIKTVLWYGYDSLAGRETLIRELRRLFLAGDFGLSEDRPWCADVHLAAIADPTFDKNPGVLGCGIATANLSKEALITCSRLGEELAQTYETAAFPDGHIGALLYQSFRLY